MKTINLIVMSIFLYAAFSAAFSIIGLFPILEQFLPKSYLIGSPLKLSEISTEHVVGHIIFGLMVGVVTFSMRHFVLAGIFPIALDSDHLIQFLNLEAVPKMAHSIAFGLIAIPLMMLVLGKKDYRLGAISFATVLTHISFDILLGGEIRIPFFIPLENKMISFEGFDWIPFLIIAITIVGVTTTFTKRLSDAKPSQKI